jgi:hypothetical protein
MHNQMVGKGSITPFFSQTFDLNGALTRVLDPLDARRQFPGNIVPQARIDKGGQALLNLFPLPNTVDPAAHLQHRLSEHRRSPAP